MNNVQKLLSNAKRFVETLYTAAVNLWQTFTSYPGYNYQRTGVAAPQVVQNFATRANARINAAHNAFMPYYLLFKEAEKFCNNAPNRDKIAEIIRPVLQFKMM